MDDETRELLTNVFEGTKAVNNYTDAEARAYWKGVEDCYKELSKICEGCYEATIKAVCIIDKKCKRTRKDNS
jgi:hypothetical protein